MWRTFGSLRIFGSARSTTTIRVSGMVYWSSTFHCWCFRWSLTNLWHQKPDVQELSHEKIQDPRWWSHFNWAASNRLQIFGVFLFSLIGLSPGCLGLIQQKSSRVKNKNQLTTFRQPLWSLQRVPSSACIEVSVRLILKSFTLLRLCSVCGLVDIMDPILEGDEESSEPEISIWNAA